METLYETVAKKVREAMKVHVNEFNQRSLEIGPEVLHESEKYPVHMTSFCYLIGKEFHAVDEDNKPIVLDERTINLYAARFRAGSDKEEAFLMIDTEKGIMYGHDRNFCPPSILTRLDDDRSVRILEALVREDLPAMESTLDEIGLFDADLMYA